MREPPGRPMLRRSRDGAAAENLLLVRHGESIFNRRYAAEKVDPNIQDPTLTPEGEAQAERLAEVLREERIEHVVTSPLTRALQTASILARRLGAPVTVDVALRERRYFECDVGTARSALVERWRGFDFGAFDEVWWAPQREVYADFLDRLRHALALLEAWSPRGTICVVTHSGVIEGLGGAVVDTGEARAFHLDQLRAAWASRRSAHLEAARAG